MRWKFSIVTILTAGDWPPPVIGTAVAAGQRPGDRHPHAMLIAMADLAVMASISDGIAYANTLKTAGAILATLSFAANAIGLGTTILGLTSDADTRDIFASSMTRSIPAAEMAIGLPRTAQG